VTVFEVTPSVFAQARDAGGAGGEELKMRNREAFTEAS
jgi:hypothetical protein